MIAEALGPRSGGVPARRPDPPAEPPPPAWKRAWRWWLGKSKIIAHKQNRGLAFLTFWIGLGPVAWWFRRTGQDPLDRALRPAAPTAFRPRIEPQHVDPQRIRRPF